MFKIMTAKEKAKKLVDRFTFSIIYFTNGFDGSKLNAKTCALLAVDELIITVNMCIPYLNEATYIEYWQQVKQEIEKL